MLGGGVSRIPGLPSLCNAGTARRFLRIDGLECSRRDGSRAGADILFCRLQSHVQPFAVEDAAVPRHFVSGPPPPRAG